MAPSTKYLTMLRCDEVSGSNVPDSSGQGNTGLFGAGNTTAWDNPGWFTSTGGVAEGGMYLADTSLPFDPWDGSSLVYMGWIKKLNGAGTEIEHGNNRRNTESGFAFQSVSANNRLSTTARNGDSADNQTPLSRGPCYDDQPRHFAFVVDGPTRTASIYIDGVLGDMPSGTFINEGAVGISLYETLTKTMQSTRSWGWGSIENSSTTGWNFECQFRGIHLLRYPNEPLPDNIHDIVQFSFNNPYTPIDESLAG